jgi:hypothetical protein
VAFATAQAAHNNPSQEELGTLKVHGNVVVVRRGKS